MAKLTKSKRPPKGWIDSCVRGVKRAAKRAHRRLRSAAGICGNTWYNIMSDAGRKKAKRKYRN